MSNEKNDFTVKVIFKAGEKPGDVSWREYDIKTKASGKKKHWSEALEKSLSKGSEAEKTKMIMHIVGCWKHAWGTLHYM